jgi:16S rRNA (guanine(527)-N(7))-methyltransferase RsmG
VKQPNQTDPLIQRFVIAFRANAKDFGVELNDSAFAKLQRYYELLLRWNDRLHLVSPCSPEEFATRHVLESLWLLRHLSENARVVDVGSGAGLPMIPCLFARNDLRATLIESSQKKAVFLREALRHLGASTRAEVIAARFEELLTPDADYVTSRALDRFEQMLPRLIEWAPVGSTLLIYGGENLRKKIEDLLSGAKVELIPQSERRFLLAARKREHLLT